MDDNDFYAAKVTLTNETEGHIFSDFTDDDIPLTEDGEPDFGALFRAARDEYGRCRSSVYVDPPTGGPPRRIGWFFESRQRYTDTDERYLRGAWVTVVSITPAKCNAVTVPGGRL